MKVDWRRVENDMVKILVKFYFSIFIVYNASAINFKWMSKFGVGVV